jgi:hypothetical protein
LIKFKKKYIQISLVIITLVMTILRFLLNEKGRTNPDSIRYMRFAHNLPEIDNTTTPLGYPAAIKFLHSLVLMNSGAVKLSESLPFFSLYFSPGKKSFSLKNRLF